MDEQSSEEFRAFMHARWPAMVRLAYGLTGDQGHAEDVAQTAFARACAAWPRVWRAGDPAAYVRQIVINENRRRFRRPRVPEQLTDRLPERAGPDLPGEYGDRAALMAALAALGPRQRAVVVLRYWLDLSEAETAAALGCSVGTVKSQAARALTRLRERMDLVDGGLR